MASDDKEGNDGAPVPHTVTEIPEKTANRQRLRRETGAHYDGELLPVQPGHYVLGDEVARGGLGRIVSAYDRLLERTVALKELVVEHPISAARFRREAKLTAQLEHPAIVPIHDAGIWPSGRPFYAMKLVEGRSLATAISDTSDFAERIALLRHVVDVAEAMAYAHNRHIIHRDLKPSNILVGAFGETVVIDWGLAKNLAKPSPEDDEVTHQGPRPGQSGEMETSEGAVLGTPAYMPPEQARGESVDERADVYALGALLYQLLGGERPYAEVPGHKLLEAVLTEPVVPLEEIEPAVPGDLCAIVAKAMSRDRDERYRNAGELADELHRYMTGKLVGAHRYSSRELLVRFLHKQKRILVTVAVSLAVLLTYGVWSVVRIASERNRAEDAAKAEQSMRIVAEEAATRESAERAKAEATTRRLLVSQARLLLAEDPTSAVATLKLLDQPVAGAASILAEAEELGVARRVIRSAAPAQVWDVDIDESGRVIACSDDSGNVIVSLDGKRTWLPIHGGLRVPTLALTPGAKAVVSGGYDGKLLRTALADMSTTEIAKLKGAVLDLSVSADGSEVAAISSDGTVSVGAIDGGERVEWTTEVGRSAFVRFSPDGRYLVSGSHGDDALLIDRIGKKARYLRGHGGPVNDAQFSPDGAHVATASDDATVRVWQVSGSATTVVRGHTSPVNSLAFSGEGDFIASGANDGSVRLAYWRRGASRLLGVHQERVTRVVFGPEGKLVLSGAWDKTARVFDTTAGSGRVFRGHRDVISALALSRDGKWLVTGSWDTTARVWALEEPNRKVLTGHRVGVKAVAFSPDGGWVASGGHDNSVRLWDVDSGRSRDYRGHRDHVFRVLFSPDGKQLASSSDDRTVRLWSTDGSWQRTLTGHGADVEELAFSPDGSFLVSAAEDNTARLWPLDGGEARVLSGHAGAVSDVTVSPNGDLIATASLDGTIRLWPASTSAQPRVLEGHSAEVWHIAFSPDGTYLASVSADETLRLWNITTGRGVVVASGLEGARVVEYSPNEPVVAVGGVRGAVWLCPADESSSCRTLRSHLGRIWQLAFSPDGEVLATAGADNSVRLWRLSSGESRVLYGHSAPVFDLAFSPDGRRLVTGSGDSTVRIWEVEMPHALSRERMDALTDYLLAD